jgi:hypothetical protein
MNKCLTDEQIDAFVWNHPHDEIAGQCEHAADDLYLHIRDEESDRNLKDLLIQSMNLLRIASVAQHYAADRERNLKNEIAEIYKYGINSFNDVD